MVKIEDKKGGPVGTLLTRSRASHIIRFDLKLREFHEQLSRL